MEKDVIIEYVTDLNSRYVKRQVHTWKRKKQKQLGIYLDVTPVSADIMTDVYIPKFINLVDANSYLLHDYELEKLNVKFIITKEGSVVGNWIVNIGTGEIIKGPLQAGSKIDVSFTLESNVLRDILDGNINVERAFELGKIELSAGESLLQFSPLILDVMRFMQP
ncbi:uncharacterized protein LOC142321041 [Lycorma delicatula]|uniref:uncharacterized protein LOC142321041 n=1 Tax=Lycorma delicatula TaxID=130591 RepID=UPI003F518E1C